MAGVAHLQARERLDVRVDRLREAPQQPGPVPRRYLAPGREGAVGQRDPLVDLGAVGEADRPEDRLIDRADHVKYCGGHRAPFPCTTALQSRTRKLAR
jgi:hypothetical protein